MSSNIIMNTCMMLSSKPTGRRLAIEALGRMLFLYMILICFAISGACSSKPKITESPGWEYQRHAIRLNLKGDPRLNLYQGIPHTLMVCFYQLRDPNSFTQVSEEQDGISRLLECSRFDPSVTRARSFVVQPGEQIDEALDRAEGTKYIGIVAGYYLQKTKQTHLLQVPIVEEKEEGALVQKPGDLKITVRLGPQEIQEVYTK
jgi:type VI secretion system VasD/TssJ family lipoprotein